ncbi:FadR/GntR family transcriptional regulator [Cupriavidus taiwanensis]|uniref:FadR/GntR family transcriptional regulator n=1 Tax=Cupriavidus taiwanensis TaxID=164546 RepID=UPI0034A025DB
MRILGFSSIGTISWAMKKNKRTSPSWFAAPVRAHRRWYSTFDGGKPGDIKANGTHMMTNAHEATVETRASAGTNVIAGILAYLQDRRLQQGDRLPSERDLAERLGVGRNAVREALATLVTLRVVESRPNSGVYLRHMSRESSFEALVLLTDIGATPTPTEITETMEVRAHLKLLAVSLACQRRTDEDLARIEAILARTEPKVWPPHASIARCSNSSGAATFPKRNA